MDSARAFLAGMFPEDAAAIAIHSAPEDDDPLLRFHKLCPAYQQYKADVLGRMVSCWHMPKPENTCAEMC